MIKEKKYIHYELEGIRKGTFACILTRQGQGQWKWFKMVEVNGAYKQGMK